MATGDTKQASSGFTETSLFPVGTFTSPELETLLTPDGALRSGKFVGGYGGALQSMIDYMSGSVPDYAERNMARVGRAGEKLSQISGLQQAQGNTGALTQGEAAQATSARMGPARAAGLSAESADSARRRGMIPTFLSQIQQPQQLRAAAPHRVRSRGTTETTTEGPGAAENFTALMGLFLEGYSSFGGGGGGGG